MSCSWALSTLATSLTTPGITCKPATSTQPYPCSPALLLLRQRPSHRHLRAASDLEYMLHEVDGLNLLRLRPLQGSLCSLLLIRSQHRDAATVQSACGEPLIRTGDVQQKGGTEGRKNQCTAGKDFRRCSCERYMYHGYYYFNAIRSSVVRMFAPSQTLTMSPESTCKTSGECIEVQKLPRILGPSLHVPELHVALDSLLFLQVQEHWNRKICLKNQPKPQDMLSSALIKTSA